MIKGKLSEISKVNNLLFSNHSPFNSKLFINLNIPPNEIDIKESESNNILDSIKLEKDNNKCFFLLYEFIKELNLSFLEEEEKNYKIIKILLITIHIL